MRRLCGKPSKRCAEEVLAGAVLAQGDELSELAAGGRVRRSAPVSLTSLVIRKHGNPLLGKLGEHVIITTNVLDEAAHNP